LSFCQAIEEIELLKFVAEVICPTNRKWTSFTYLSVIGLYEENKIVGFVQSVKPINIDAGQSYGAPSEE